MTRFGRLLAVVIAGLASSVALAQTKRPLSPRGTTSAQVGGHWEKASNGEMRYQGGKWVDIDYGRPILRGRSDIFSEGGTYGKGVNAGASIWRAGANQTTKLTTEVPLEFEGHHVPAGAYDIFVKLNSSTDWVLVLSTQPSQEKYNPKDKSKIWGSYGYESKYDVITVPMKVIPLDHTVEQLTYSFMDMNENGGTLTLAWDKTAGMVPFTIGK